MTSCGLCFIKVRSIQFFYGSSSTDEGVWIFLPLCVCAQAQGLEITILFKTETHQFHYNRVWMPLCELKAGWIFAFKTDLRFVRGGQGFFCCSPCFANELGDCFYWFIGEKELVLLVHSGGLKVDLKCWVKGWTR